MINELVNEDIEKTAKNVKSSEEAVEAVNEMEKIIKCYKCNILWLAYQLDQIFERLKKNDIFINMVEKFRTSKIHHGFQNIYCKIYKKISKNEKVFTFSSFFKE